MAATDAHLEFKASALADPRLKPWAPDASAGLDHEQGRHSLEKPRSSCDHWRWLVGQQIRR